MKDDLRIELSRTKDRKFYLDPYEYVDDSLWRISQRNWKKRIWEKEIGTFNQLRVEFSRSIDKVSVGYIAWVAPWLPFENSFGSTRLRLRHSRCTIVCKTATKKRYATLWRSSKASCCSYFSFSNESRDENRASFLSHAIKDACRVSMFSRLFGSV